jgi:hypothetical protein
MISESKTITSVDDDPGITAQAVRRWYKPVVSRLLEMHHWGLATKKTSLVQLLDNSRVSEWLYAFAVPEDMAFPVDVAIGTGLASISYYRGLSGLLGMLMGKRIFLYQNRVIYANILGDLEYVSYDITEADFNSTFENIVVLMLASRLALELPKDMKMSQELAKQALTEINVAMAMNMNSGHPKYGAKVSEAELARGSVGNGWGGFDWDYFPGSL